MQGCELLGTDSLNGTMFSLGAFPGVHLGYADRRFIAEVYKTPADDKDLIQALDGYEGEGHLYRRVVVPTKFGDAWVYEFLGQKPAGLHIEDWKVFRRG